MANKNTENFEIDCTCLDLYEKVTKRYYFNDCSIIKKCIKNGILKESDSVCIYGKENCGKTLLLTEILVDLTAVKELRGMNCKVVYLDCDLSFNYQNYENIINNKFLKYISNCSTVNTDEYKNINLKKEYLDNSFSNIYYIPIFNPGHLLVILNTLKNLLEKKILVEALIIDSLSFWNFCKYDKVNFFSDNSYVKRNTSDLLDYAFTLILNLKKKFRFLFFYTKLSSEDKFIEYTINLSVNEKLNEQMNDVEICENKNTNNFSINKSSDLKQVFLIPQNFNDILKTHIFRKKDFITNNFLIEKPFLIFLISNEKSKFTHIKNRNDLKSLNFLLCLSSEMKDLDKTHYSKFFFMIINSHTIVPL
ncbi:P-loop containing nucleoside triphosphate hydrolase, putative [Plasmodium relictum]|uniref:p-loop containing nucleoside triphosphate hydrolase, putative n=1 Tax=Plasmodium relictum TaxID=85471 RepID=A0A1J1HA20_PLARL|nr:P-loop containing nucleoside triphosphate hydrolase, putative [Plasmodium relictum]CRH00274.1 P-loop containing nucleoside triphosphate hydrolase, putative [Plasmodium relictum]